jgi:hypothetical protein
MSTEKTGSRNDNSQQPADLPDWLVLVRKQVDSLKFGTVQITVHDSQVTQVERLEKVRLDRPRQQS